MHPSMQQHVDGLAAMRARTTLPPANLHVILGLTAPAQSVRYQLVAKDKAYHIIERSTGKTRVFCFNYKVAVNPAQALIARRVANEHRQPYSRPTAASKGRPQRADRSVLRGRPAPRSDPFRRERRMLRHEDAPAQAARRA